jgi:hypothetical protein
MFADAREHIPEPEERVDLHQLTRLTKLRSLAV